MPSETRELVRRAREWAQGIRGLPYVADRAQLLEQLADIAERAEAATMSEKRVAVKFRREDGRYISPEGVEIGVPDLLANAHHIKGDDGLVLLPLRHPAAVAAVEAGGGNHD